ncbi:MAG: MotE family protein [Hyphomicrobiales bacterium]
MNSAYSRTRIGLLMALFALASASAFAQGVDGKRPEAGTKPLNLHPTVKKVAKKHGPPRQAQSASTPNAQLPDGRPAAVQGGEGQTGIQTAAGHAVAAQAPANPTAVAPSAAAAAPGGPAAAQPAPKAPAAQASAPTPEQPKAAAEAKPSIPPIVSLPPATVEPKKAELKPAGLPAATTPPQPTQAQLYCSNIAATAADARFAWQAKRLTELEAQLQQRISELDAKQAEYKDWLQKREEFQKKADDNVVAIYSRMRPEAAASQLAVMEDATAAAILAKLNARSAGAILNEMDAGRAARLTDAMAGLPPASPKGKKS